MVRGKQSVKKGVWYIGGRYKRAPKRRQRGRAIPLGLLPSIGAPIFGEIAKPIFGKIFGRGEKKKKTKKMVKKHNLKKKSKSKM